MFNISPSITIQETDLTLSVVTLADYIGASAGFAQWGPADKPTLITTGEDELISIFQKPDDNTYLDLLTMTDFFAYSPKAWYTRVVGPTAKNATESGFTALLAKNDDDIQVGQDIGTFNGIQFLAKYPGALGNGLMVDIADTAKFQTWEFKNAFNYAPKAGEYAIAVVDTSGNFSSGVGEAKQQERLSLYGAKVVGGVREARTATLSGAVSVGTNQIDNISFQGTLTADTTLTLSGVTVNLLSGDTALTAATKTATALAAATATYSAATATGTTVSATRTAKGLFAAPASSNANGLTVVGTIALPGSNTGNLTIMDITIPVVDGDSIATTRQAIIDAMLARPNQYTAVTPGAAGVINFSYTAYGPSGKPTANETSAGVTAAYTITTPGSNSANISVFGNTVAVLNGESPAQTAVRIATVLQGDAAFSNLYESVTADGASVTYRRKVVGRFDFAANPADQVGISFGVSASVVGRLGTILEQYEIVTTDKTSRYPDGSSRYYADAIKSRSKYVFVGDRKVALSARSVKLVGGVDDYNTTRVAALSRYDNAEQMDLNYVFTAGGPTEQKAIGDVVETRRDCIAFFAPALSDVVNTPGNELANVKTWRNNVLNRDTSYGVCVDNWGLVYDKYNDVNRWIPAVAGTAGLMARTAYEVDPWVSPAGHQRGKYKRYLKMAWSANKAQRDELYKIGVNSIVTFPNEGIVLFGDKTATTRPSSFDRINVRMAFIVAEKSIANFAKQFLFEVNDAFTQSQFLNAVRPFLRNMVSRRAFEDAKVIADDTNNTGYIKSTNQFVGTILLKPLYSINFINLNFVAVGPSVSFDEVVSQLS